MNRKWLHAAVWTAALALALVAAAMAARSPSFKLGNQAVYQGF